MIMRSKKPNIWSEKPNISVGKSQHPVGKTQLPVGKTQLLVGKTQLGRKNPTPGRKNPTCGRKNPTLYFLNWNSLEKRWRSQTNSLPLPTLQTYYSPLCMTRADCIPKHFYTIRYIGGSLFPTVSRGRMFVAEQYGLPPLFLLQLRH